MKGRAPCRPAHINRSVDGGRPGGGSGRSTTDGLDHGSPTDSGHRAAGEAELVDPAKQK
jgi:hypothetical protein